MLSTFLKNKKLVTICAAIFVLLLLVSFRKLFDGFQDGAAEAVSTASPECQTIISRKANLQKALAASSNDIIKTNLQDAMAKLDADSRKNSC